MHACMKFDVYLSDPHYTEKVAICCGGRQVKLLTIFVYRIKSLADLIRMKL